MSALIKISFPSRVLLKPVEIVASLPVSAEQEIPVLWALHCAMEDGNYFFRYLDASRLSTHLNIAIIAPSLGNGFFLNSAYEPQADFLEEIHDSLPRLLRISSSPDKNAVLGISMGGFGAMRWTLESGHFFSAAAISGAFDADLPADPHISRDPSLFAIHQAFDGLMRARLTDYKGALPNEGNLKSLLNKSAWPKLYFYCGEEDYLSLNQTSAFYEACKKAGAPVNLRLHPGSHNLEFWRWAFPDAVKEIFKGNSA